MSYVQTRHMETFEMFNRPKRIPHEIRIQYIASKTYYHTEGDLDQWPFSTRGRIIRLDELGQTFVVRLVIRL